MPTHDSTDKGFHDYLTGLNTGYSGGTMMGELGRMHHRPPPVYTPPPPPRMPHQTATPAYPVAPRDPLPPPLPPRPDTLFEKILFGTYLDGIADDIEDGIERVCSTRAYHIAALVFAAVCGIAFYLAAANVQVPIALSAALGGWLAAYIVPKALGLFAQFVAGLTRFVHGLAVIAAILGLAAGVLWLAVRLVT